METLVSALTPIDHVRGPKTEVQPTLMNSDMLSGEMGSISLLLSLLVSFSFPFLFLCMHVRARAAVRARAHLCVRVGLAIALYSFFSLLI